MLANERTLLAYFRTTLSLVVAGLAFIKFFENINYQWIGRSFIVMGVIILFKGCARYTINKRSIMNVEDNIITKEVSK